MAFQAVFRHSHSHPIGHLRSEADRNSHGLEDHATGFQLSANRLLIVWIVSIPRVNRDSRSDANQRRRVLHGVMQL